MATTELTVPEIEDNMSNRSSITTVSDAAKLDGFVLNPFNIRDLSDITIELVTEEKTTDGVTERVVSVDSNGRPVGFELSRAANVTVDYRQKFQEFLDSLVKIEDGKARYKALMPFKTTRKMPAFDAEKVEGAVLPTYWTVIEGNTRLHILKTAIALLGKENVEFEFSYFIDNACDSPEQLLAAPDAGNNSFVPVLGTATTQAEKAYQYALGQQPADMAIEDKIKEALKFVKKVVALAGRSAAFFTNFKTIKVYGDTYLDDVSRQCLAFGEIQYRYILFWRDIDGAKAEGVTLDDLLEKASLARYIEYLGYSSLDSFTRITTRSKLNVYCEWVNKVLNEGKDEPETEDDTDGENSEDTESEESTGDSSNTSETVEFTEENLTHLCETLGNITEAVGTTDPVIVAAHKSDIIKMSKTLVEVLLNTEHSTELLSFITKLVKETPIDASPETMQKVQKTADKLTKSLFK